MDDQFQKWSVDAVDSERKANFLLLQAEDDVQQLSEPSSTLQSIEE